jgi:hypothetical protein
LQEDIGKWIDFSANKTENKPEHRELVLVSTYQGYGLVQYCDQSDFQFVIKWDDYEDFMINNSDILYFMRIPGAPKE